MRFVTWNVRSLFTVGSLKAAASEIAKYDLGPVAIQEVRGGDRGSKQA
jgi:hypothetical protein